MPRRGLCKNGVFALRVVPNGVDATTAEWEGGAGRFMQEGQRICFWAEWKKTPFYRRHLVMMVKIIGGEQIWIETHFNYRIKLLK